MSEGNKRFAIVMAFLLTAFFILAVELPQGVNALSTIWTFLSAAATFIFLLLLMFITFLFVVFAPMILGLAAKGAGVQAIDPNLRLFPRAVLGLTAAAVTGLGWIALMYLVIYPLNWVYQIVNNRPWGNWEMPPIGWGIYAFLAFIASWAVVDHRTEEQIDRDKAAAKLKENHQ